VVTAGASPGEYKKIGFLGKTEGPSTLESEGELSEELRRVRRPKDSRRAFIPGVRKKDCPGVKRTPTFSNQRATDPTKGEGVIKGGRIVLIRK